MTAQAQTSNRVFVQAPAAVRKKQFCIRHGTTNAEYRQQILASIPLGSSFEQVQAFAQAELQSETHPADSMFDPAIIGERNTLGYIESETQLCKSNRLLTVRQSELQEQPSLAQVLTPQRHLTKGTDYMATQFQAKPFPLGPWINLGVLFIFDGKHRLINVSCHAGSRVTTGP